MSLRGLTENKNANFLSDLSQLALLNRSEIYNVTVTIFKHFKLTVHYRVFIQSSTQDKKLKACMLELHVQSLFMEK